MILNVIFGSLAVISFILLLWQWLAARRFPLHQQSAAANPGSAFQPAVTCLKSLKGADASTEACLRSWFAQSYSGEIQILFGVASTDDPVCAIVKKLQQEFPSRDVQLVVVSPITGPNAKISKLTELEKIAKHEIFVISDADVRVAPDFLSSAVLPLADKNIGLVNCFYRLANASTLAMQWEAIAINADFWSQVLQSQTLKPLDFALGAVMFTRRAHLAEIGGFESLKNCLADDYQLGNRIARQGHRILLSPIVVECWDPPMGWGAVWRHQLRWARTIRVSQPVPYFFSILSNAGFWALLYFAYGTALTIRASHLHPTSNSYHFAVNLWDGVLLGGFFLVARIIIVSRLQSRLTPSSKHWRYLWLVPIKDLLQFAIWLCAFGGNHIEWRGQMFKLNPDGTLIKADSSR